ncbi:hypothetical protein [Saccharothrix sp. ST-888]|nr:hypothetical protein [Saccharothrix sp. ST-888]
MRAGRTALSAIALLLAAAPVLTACSGGGPSDDSVLHQCGA